MVDSAAYLAETVQSNINQYIPGPATDIQTRDNRFKIIHVQDYPVYMEFAAGIFTEETANKGRPLLGISNGTIISDDDEEMGFPGTLSWVPLRPTALYLTPEDVKMVAELPAFLLFKVLGSSLTRKKLRSYMGRNTGLLNTQFPMWRDCEDLVYYVDTCISNWMRFHSIGPVDVPGNILHMTQQANQLYGNSPGTQEKNSCSD